MVDTKPQAFICHSPTDQDSADLLVSQMQQGQGSRRFGVFIPSGRRGNPSPPDHLIRNGLHTSTVVLSLIGSEIGPWQASALNQAVQRGRPILGLITDKASPASMAFHKRLNIPVVEWAWSNIVPILDGEYPSLDFKPDDCALILPRAILEVNFPAMSCELTRILLKEPHVIHQFSPRQFEEYVAYLLEKLGYQVTLTQQTRDHGVDIYALHKDSLGDILTIIDCKKYSLSRPVGVGVVRSLYGVLQIEKASHAMVATTSTFSDQAQALQKEYRHQISLKDHADLLEWTRLVHAKTIT